MFDHVLYHAAAQSPRIAAPVERARTLFSNLVPGGDADFSAVAFDIAQRFAVADDLPDDSSQWSEQIWLTVEAQLERSLLRQTRSKREVSLCSF